MIRKCFLRCGDVTGNDRNHQKLATDVNRGEYSSEFNLQEKMFSLSWARLQILLLSQTIRNWASCVNIYRESESGEEGGGVGAVVLFWKGALKLKGLGLPVNWAIRKQVVNNQLSKCKLLYCTIAVWGWVRVKSSCFLKMQLDFEL